MVGVAQRDVQRWLVDVLPRSSVTCCQPAGIGWSAGVMSRSTENAAGSVWLVVLTMT